MPLMTALLGVRPEGGRSSPAEVYDVKDFSQTYGPNDDSWVAATAGILSAAVGNAPPSS